MSESDLEEYLSKLWAMLTWGNKRYYIDKLIADNGLDALRRGLAELLYSDAPLPKRWDDFRGEIKGIGPAMASELLAHVHPSDCMVWNRKAKLALERLGETDLPQYLYQCTGKAYEGLCARSRRVASVMKEAGFDDVDMLFVDYFLALPGLVWQPNYNPEGSKDSPPLWKSIAILNRALFLKPQARAFIF